MKKVFAQNILFLLLVNLLIKPIWIFGIDLQVQKTLGNATYGSYQAFMSFCIIFQIILDMGLQNYANRSIAKSPNAFYTLFPNVMIAKVGLSALYLGIVSTLGYLFGYSGWQLSLLVLIGLIQVVQSFYLFLRSNLAAKQLFRTDSLLSILDRLLLVVCCGALLYIPLWRTSFTIETFVLAQIATLFLSCLIAFGIIKKHFVVYWRSFKLLKVIGVIKQSLPFALLVFLMAVFMRVDQLLLDQIVDTTAVGQYAGLFRFLDAANNMSGVLIGGMLLSFFGKYYRTEEVIRNICKLCNFTLIPLSLLVPILCFFYGEELVGLINLHLGIAINLHFGILMMAFPAYCLMYVYSTLLTAMGKLNTLIRIALLACTCSILGNLILQPSYGVLGACMMHAFTMWLLVALQIVYSNRQFSKAILSWKTIGYYLFLFWTTFSFAFWIKTTELPWMIQMALILALGLMVIAVLNAQDIKKLLMKVRHKFVAK